jgi:formamidopyrimidine-DNA glycosylase
VPELPDIAVYIEALEKRILGETLGHVRLNSAFLLRSVEPPLDLAAGRNVTRLRRVGKRIAIGLEGNLWLVLHLMIAGRLHWRKPNARLAGKNALAAFDFPAGSLVLTEAGSQRRASLSVALGDEGLKKLDPGGVEPLEADLKAFVAALTGTNHTLKRALTDPHLFSGIGNAYSDEILHRARLSPLLLTQKLDPDQICRLYEATQSTLRHWIARLRIEAGDRFPTRVTAFHEAMAVHGKFRQRCPDCGAKIQRIRYAANETNYCPGCQTGGRLLADRALSRLLREDWPRRFEELE